jgi:hypothetical protein
MDPDDAAREALAEAHDRATYRRFGVVAPDGHVVSGAAAHGGVSEDEYVAANRAQRDEARWHRAEAARLAAAAGVSVADSLIHEDQRGRIAVHQFTGQRDRPFRRAATFRRRPASLQLHTAPLRRVPSGGRPKGRRPSASKAAARAPSDEPPSDDDPPARRPLASPGDVATSGFYVRAGRKPCKLCGGLAEAATGRGWRSLCSACRKRAQRDRRRIELAAASDAGGLEHVGEVLARWSA